MADTIDDRYLFRFITPEREIPGAPPGAGGTHVRAIYWEDLYVLKTRRDPFLAAVCTVPAAEELFALYMVLKENMRWQGRERPGSGDSGDAPGAAETSAGAVLVRGVRALAGIDKVQLPARMNVRAEELVTTAVVRSLTLHHLEPVIDSSFFEPVPGQEDATESAPSARQYPFLSAPGGEDVAWVRAGNDLFAELTQTARSLQLSLPRQPRKGTPLVKPRSVSDILWQLYGNPRCLTVVAKVMAARGGFVSPLVKHFLGLLWRLLQEEGYRQPGLGWGDERFWRERLLGILGRAEAEMARRESSCEVTVLGRVARGALRPSAEDPQRSPHRFHLDPRISIPELLLREVRGRAARARATVLVRREIHRPVKAVRFAGDD